MGDKLTNKQAQHCIWVFSFLDKEEHIPPLRGADHQLKLQDNNEERRLQQAPLQLNTPLWWSAGATAVFRSQKEQRKMNNRGRGLEWVSVCCFYGHKFDLLVDFLCFVILNCSYCRWNIPSKCLKLFLSTFLVPFQTCHETIDRQDVVKQVIRRNQSDTLWQ